jgi:hypothetical protein
MAVGASLTFVTVIVTASSRTIRRVGGRHLQGNRARLLLVEANPVLELQDAAVVTSKPVVAGDREAVDRAVGVGGGELADNGAGRVLGNRPTRQCDGRGAWGAGVIVRAWVLRAVLPASSVTIRVAVAGPAGRPVRSTVKAPTASGTTVVRVRPPSKLISVLTMSASRPATVKAAVEPATAVAAGEGEVRALVGGGVGQLADLRDLETVDVRAVGAVHDEGNGVLSFQELHRDLHKRPVVPAVRTTDPSVSVLGKRMDDGVPSLTTKLRVRADPDA